MRTYSRINEDYLDKTDIQLDDVNVVEDAREEIDAWLSDGSSLSFNLEILPDGFYPVSDRETLQQIIVLSMREFGPECDLNWVDVSDIEMMVDLFSGSRRNFNGDISRWDVSNVVAMAGLFYNSEFNGDISNWNVSNVTDMSNMFCGSKFNGDISKWNVSNVTNMCGMFIYSSFNGDVSKWDVSKVEDMSGMFSQTKFSGDVSRWNVSSATDMSYMFNKATEFNCDLSDWDVSRVRNMKSMFSDSSVDCDLSSWDVHSVLNHDEMFTRCPMWDMPDRHPKFPKRHIL